MIKAFLPLTANVLLVAFASSALVMLEASLAAKVLIASGSVLIALLCYLILGLSEKLTESYMTLRLIFISVETKRLDPENSTPAMRILSNDLEEERQQKEVSASLGRSPIANSIMFWAFYAIALVSVVIFFVYSWPSNAT